MLINHGHFFWWIQRETQTFSQSSAIKATSTCRVELAYKTKSIYYGKKNIRGGTNKHKTDTSIEQHKLGNLNSKPWPAEALSLLVLCDRYHLSTSSRSTAQASGLLEIQLQESPRPIEKGHSFS